jgi:hypothetical protein
MEMKMIKDREQAREGFFQRFWRNLQIFAEIAETSETEMLARRIERIERRVNPPAGPGAQQ